MMVQKYEKKRWFSKIDRYNIHTDNLNFGNSDNFLALSKKVIFEPIQYGIVMKKEFLIIKSFLVVIALLLVFNACSASTGSRYEKKVDVKSVNTETKSESTKTSTLNENFDITPYKTEIIIPEKNTNTISSNPNVWFNYGSAEDETKTKTLVGTSDGFRVLILTTDNIEEANQIKADVYFSKNSSDVYIDFEPPFYKVKAGDFDTQKSADDLRFKLNQLGYKEAKVIKDKINIYK